MTRRATTSRFPTRKRHGRRRLRTARYARLTLWLGIIAIATYVAARWGATGEREWQAVAMDYPVCGEVRGAAGCVIDGDTLAIGRDRVRLTGFDAPELKGECRRERELAIRARRELADWLAQGPFEWTGGDAPPRDDYGRTLREVRRGGRSLADHMIDQGLATDTGWGGSDHDWCAP